MARRPVDSLLEGVAQAWQLLGLPAEDTADRVLEIETKLEAVALPLLDAEKAFLEKTRGEVLAERAKASALAEELGQALKLSEKTALLEQLEDARREYQRLEASKKQLAEELANALSEAQALSARIGDEFRVSKTPTLEEVRCELDRLEARQKRQTEEFQELVERVRKEVERMGADAERFAVPPDASGIEGMRLANQRLRQLDALEGERVAEVQRARARIRAMVAELGESLEFRLALEGELTGSDDGMCILAHTKDNERFIRDLVKYEGARGRGVLASARFSAHLKQLEDEYSKAVAEKRAKTGNSGHGDYRSHQDAADDADLPPAGSAGGAVSAASGGGSSCSSSGDASSASGGSCAREDERCAGGRRRPAAQAAAGARESGRGEGRGGEGRGREGKPPWTRRDRASAWRPRQGQQEGFRGSSPYNGSGKREAPRGPQGPRRRRSPRRPEAWRVRNKASSRSRSRPREAAATRTGAGGAEVLRVPSESPPSPKEYKPRSAETCRAALCRMTGEWADESGTRYQVDQDVVRRSDGKKFTLIIDRGFIDWGRSGKYFAEPDGDMQSEVRWICDRTRQQAFAWQRTTRAPTRAAAGATSARRSLAGGGAVRRSQAGRIAALAERPRASVRRRRSLSPLRGRSRNKVAAGPLLRGLAEAPVASVRRGAGRDRGSGRESCSPGRLGPARSRVWGSRRPGRQRPRAARHVHLVEAAGAVCEGTSGTSTTAPFGAKSATGTGGGREVVH